MKHVLLLEPNKGLANIIQKYLQEGSLLEVDVSHSAQEAIFKADAQLPDLVILELAIPMHNGFAFLHEFRSYTDWKNVPVIVHSHLDRDEAEMSKSWKTLGAKAYFYKPNTTLLQLKNASLEALNLPAN